MDKEFLDYVFATYTDYGKVPENKREFMNKFEPYEYKAVLYQLLYSSGVFEWDEDAL